MSTVFSYFYLPYLPCRVTAIASTITFLPINSIFVHTPITNTCHPSIRNWCTSTNHLPPSTIPYIPKTNMFIIVSGHQHNLILCTFLYTTEMKLTNEPSWPLLDYLYAKCPRCMRLVWITINRYIAFWLERPVHTTIVLVSV